MAERAYCRWRYGSDWKKPGKKMAPQVGLEPTTLRLTAECSAIELLRSVARHAAPYGYSRRMGTSVPQPVCAGIGIISFHPAAIANATWADHF